jgi:hypothetical protein
MKDWEMEKRRVKRIRKKLMVGFSDNGFDGLAMTENISREGLCVESDIELPPHKEIILSVAVPGGIFNLRGEVVWYKSSGDIADDVPDLIGIRLTEIPAEYQDYVEYIRCKRGH